MLFSRLSEVTLKFCAQVIFGTCLLSSMDRVLSFFLVLELQSVKCLLLFGFPA